MNDGVLLVGGAGFLGRNLARSLEKSGIPVAILDRSPPPGSLKQTDWFSGDLRDTNLLRTALSGYQRVVYLAHDSRIAPASDQLPANFLSNIELFLTVLAEARTNGVGEFFLLSSGGAVYGEPLQIPIQEDHPLDPKSAYGIAKLTMEKYLAMVANQDRFRHVAIRPSNPYGPGQNFRAAQGIVAVAMAKIARKETLTIYGDGQAIKDYIFIDDFSEACVRLISEKSAVGTFNVGSGQGIALLDLISQLEAAVGKSARLTFTLAQTGDVGKNVLDCSKINTSTQWNPKTPLGSGLEKTWEWMQRELAHVVKTPSA